MDGIPKGLGIEHTAQVRRMFQFTEATTLLMYTSEGRIQEKDTTKKDLDPRYIWLWIFHKYGTFCWKFHVDYFISLVH